jgi:hypothetical protein
MLDAGGFPRPDEGVYSAGPTTLTTDVLLANREQSLSGRERAAVAGGRTLRPRAFPCCRGAPCCDSALLLTMR